MLANFTLRQLEVFEAVARLGNVSRAAEELHLSQPAASMAIRSLEKALDVALFERTKRGLELTDAGRSLRPRVHSVIAVAADLGRGLGVTSPPPTLRIAASSTISKYLLAQWINPLLEEEPETHIHIQTMNSMEVLESVDNLEADLGMIEIATMRPSLDVIRWGTEPLAIFCSAQHPLAGDPGRVTFEQLAAAVWHLPPRFVDVRRSFTTAFVARGDQMRLGLESTTWSLIKAVVEAGRGVSCLPLVAIRQELNEGRLVRLHVPELDLLLPLSLIVRRDVTPSTSAAALMRILSESASGRDVPADTIQEPGHPDR